MGIYLVGYAIDFTLKMERFILIHIILLKGKMNVRNNSEEKTDG